MPCPIFTTQPHPLLLASVTAASAWLLWRTLRRGPGLGGLKGKCVLITGASSGLGRAIAQAAHLAGARVILLARSLDKLEELSGELSTAHPNSPRPVYRFLDLADGNTPFGDLVRECLLEAGAESLGLLVNNAGLSVRASAADTDISVHRRLMEVRRPGPGVSVGSGCRESGSPGQQCRTQCPSLSR